MQYFTNCFSRYLASPVWNTLSDRQCESIRKSKKAEIIIIFFKNNYN